ncbi:hypothetical protein ACTMU2_27700 [Cupriavidus basilensis]
MLDPQFQGQIKERLNSRRRGAAGVDLQPPGAGVVAEPPCRVRQEAGRTRDPPGPGTHARGAEGGKEEGVGRGRAARQADRLRVDRRHAQRTVPGRGRLGSAASAKMGRDKEFQAILPLRGKVLNTWETERDRLFANNEVHDIAVAIGVDPHGPNDEPDLSNLRYGKICILS